MRHSYSPGREADIGKNGMDHYSRARLCNNCKSPNRFIRDFDKLKNLVNNVANIIPNKKPAEIRQVLYEVWMQAENAVWNDDDPMTKCFSEGREINDSQKIFEATD
jgi:hypothetical protein